MTMSNPSHLTKGIIKRPNLLRNWYYFFSVLFLLLFILLFIVNVITVVSPGFIIEDSKEIFNWDSLFNNSTYRNVDFKKRTLNEVILSVSARSYNLSVYSIISVFVSSFFICYTLFFLLSYFCIHKSFNKIGVYFFIKKEASIYAFWTIILLFSLFWVSLVYNSLSIPFFKNDWNIQIDNIKNTNTYDSSFCYYKNLYSIGPLVFSSVMTLINLISLTFWDIYNKKNNKK